MLDKSEKLAVYEIALMALRDAEIFDNAAIELDLSDKEMQNLREKLQNYMENKNEGSD